MNYDKKAAWSASFSVILCSIAIAVLQNKVVPCLDAIQAEFSLSNAAGGWLSSIFSVTGIIMAFPAALIVDRFGVKRVNGAPTRKHSTCATNCHEAHSPIGKPRFSGGNHALMVMGRQR